MTTSSIESRALQVPLMTVSPSTTNPRKHFDENYIAELADSIKTIGLMQPIIVRRHGAGSDSRYVIIAGECRWRASKLAGRESIDVIVRDVTDDQVLEMQLVENLRRRDLHPMEEAEGYRQLTLTKKYDVARIAERVGKSVKYVYDRIKLLGLIPEAQKLFIEDAFTPGHAILLARLTPEDQKRAIEWDVDAGHFSGVNGLFVGERDLFAHDHADEIEGEPKPAPRKAVSVREFAAWIDRNVRLAPSHPELPMYFTETADTLGDAIQEEQKIVLITRANFIPPEAREGSRILFPRSWRRADGTADSNDPQSYEFKGYKPSTCEHGVMGFVAVGRGRGEAFLVCTAKKKCLTHWKDAMAATKRRAKEASSPSPANASAQSSRDSYEERHKAQMAETARVKKATPKLLAALLPILRRAPVKPKSAVWEIAEDDLYVSPEDLKTFGPIKSADDLMRAHALSHLAPRGYIETVDNVARDFKQFGIDAKKIIDEAAPIEKPKVAATPTKSTAKKESKTKAKKRRS